MCLFLLLLILNIYSILFYQDVGKETEEGTAAKTRPIHNSEKKWADRAISGAKLVVGWFGTGEEKNIEITERTEHRKRKQFRIKQYKKPR